MPERMSDSVRWNVRINMPYYALYIYILPDGTVCQKLCQNSVSGWGSLKESISFLGWHFPTKEGAVPRPCFIQD